MLSNLELLPAIRHAEKLSENCYKSERNFLDIAVDGRSLWELAGRRRDAVSIFCREFEIAETIKAVDRLLLSEPAELPCDRRALFLCAECGDLGCGAITIAVSRHEDQIIWKDFGFENTYEQRVWFDDYRDIGPFTFESASYKQTLLHGIDLISDRA